jgi:hypothetical protein
MDPCWDVSVFVFPEDLEVLTLCAAQPSSQLSLLSPIALGCKVCRLGSAQRVSTDSRAEYIARALSDYLTAETGVVVVFESAIVPKWKDSRISFKNVYISRRPGNKRPASPEKQDPHRASVVYHMGHYSSDHHFGEYGEESATDNAEEDANYAQFDMSVDSIDVTLSLWRWFDGKGLIEDAVIKGVRGVLGWLVHSGMFSH